jgi:Flp pilus assembly protein TadD
LTGLTEMPKHSTSERDDLIELGFLEGLRARRPGDPRILKPLGDLYTKVGRVEEGLAVDLEIIRLCSNDPVARYNLACSYALSGRCDEAIEALTVAVQLGYDDQAWMREDKDLASIWEDPRFEALCELMRRDGPAQP